MAAKLKKLSDQTIVITGATSGIGLVTARTAARRGARLVIAGRTEGALRQLEAEINGQGGECLAVVADVANQGDVERIANAAVERFHGFDTWVNNAGVSTYGKIEQISLEDHRQLFETNFWGVVHGSLAALKQLKRRGGALINVGSTLSDRAIPLQGMYVASKHAVKGFTDSLRMELEEEKAPVSVTLIKPAAIDTPYTQHAKNYLDEEPKNPAPVYAPEAVAEAILYCAAHPVRDVFVGGAGKMFSAMDKYAPRLTDRVMERTMFAQQHSGRPRQSSGDRGLYQGRAGLDERGGYEGHVMESSLYTKASLHPFLTGAAVVGTGLLAAAALFGANGGTRRR